MIGRMDKRGTGHGAHGTGLIYLSGRADGRHGTARYGFYLISPRACKHVWHIDQCYFIFSSIIVFVLMSIYLCPAILFLPYLLYMNVFATLFSFFRVLR
ncbi:hypothetical protein BO79DRAFT_73386 [Aspergillus costaricaensis CBS 115574]|uniref:Uncharacterized protein n=1 Tax=Aspergillus costaricaensis CBS 115574 TaxID=1448317 RepID=A0ACD1HY40_9EURO|nr:hypothetical protein BO79DRAFT_73386 [Aspergillus costaricaensis CBS 115574]RAK83174.1 hypothetical protein BO79DRAFT_73386 [Aspergillus costaricaensis CBS 115574]